MSVFFQLLKNFYFTIPPGMLLLNMVISAFFGLQLFGFLCFLFLLYICQGNLSVKSRNTLLLSIRRVH